MRLESSVPFTPLEVPKKEQENNERVNEADPTPFPRRRHDWRKGVPALNLEDSGSNPGRQFESSCVHHLESISLAVRGSSKDLSRVMNPRGKYPHG